MFFNPLDGSSGKAKLRKNKGRTEVYMKLSSGESIILKTFTAIDVDALEYHFWNASSLWLKGDTTRSSLGTIALNNKWSFHFINTTPNVTSAPDSVYLGSCFALGLEAGVPIKEAALSGGVAPLYAGLPVIFLVTFGGFLTNAVYCIQQNVKNKTGKEYLSVDSNVLINNILLCALAGGLWYSQFFGLEMGKSFLIESPVLLAFS